MQGRWLAAYKRGEHRVVLTQAKKLLVCASAPLVPLRRAGCDKQPAVRRIHDEVISAAWFGRFLRSQAVFKCGKWRFVTVASSAELQFLEEARRDR